MKDSARSRWIGILLLPMVIGCTGPPSISGQAGLTPCPDSPNCVSSLAARPGRRVAPLSFEGDGQGAMQRLLVLLKGMPRSRIAEVKGDLIRAEFHTRVFRFKDDVTFWLDEPNKVIHLRSASRSGYYDFGVNRKRAQAIGRLWRKEETHDE